MTLLSYQHRVLQTGSLPLRPGARLQRVPHACTATLIWPDDAVPTPENSVVTDPCFTGEGFVEASAVLRELGVGFDVLGSYFETHQHGDHMLSFPSLDTPYPERRFQPGSDGPLAGVSAVHCPGHSPDLHALVFRSGNDEVWIASDAIIDEEWLRAWRYYWPNGYSDEEIVETWRSVGRILARAHVVVPGHGPPLRVTARLLEELAKSFEQALFTELCPEVGEQIRRRLASDASLPADA
jgi:glyoxylase-like metal-dependent hydrolase (beta-lactamase superfamily II)